MLISDWSKIVCLFFFFYKQKTAYEMRISDWSSDVCSSDLRGARLTQLLKQPQFSPLPVEEQVVSIFAGVRGYIDSIAVDEVNRFEEGLLNEVRSKGADILQTIREEKQLSPQTEEKLGAFIQNFVKVFA